MTCCDVPSLCREPKGLWGRSAQRSAKGLAFTLLIGLIVHGWILLQDQVSRGMASPGQAPASDSADDLPEDQAHHTAKTLRFQVCNGFANQRLAIAYGIVRLAKKPALC